MLSTKPEDIQSEVADMCDTLLQQIQENVAYAEKCRSANDIWEKNVRIKRKRTKCNSLKALSFAIALIAK